jgi:hypothetical protein
MLFGCWHLFHNLSEKILSDISVILNQSTNLALHIFCHLPLTFCEIVGVKLNKNPVFRLKKKNRKNRFYNQLF